jgi:tetratricopeptide (TPR) repeat protein
MIIFILLMGADLTFGESWSFDNPPPGGALDQAIGIGGSGPLPPIDIPEPTNINEPTPPEPPTTPRVQPPKDGQGYPSPGSGQSKEDEQKIHLEKAYNLNEEGNEAYKNRKWQDAIKYYKEALKYSPNDPIIRQNLKNAELQYEQVKKYEQEKKEELRAQEKIGDEASRSGNWHKAIEAYESVLRWDPFNYHVRQKMEKAFVQMKGKVVEMMPPSFQAQSLDIESISRNRYTGTQISLGDGSLPSGLRKIGGLTDQEWREARGYQKEIEVISKKMAAFCSRDIPS